MLIERTSIISGVTRTRDINVSPHQMYRITTKKELIQNVVPHLTATEREFIKTGITESEWDTLFIEKST